MEQELSCYTVEPTDLRVCGIHRLLNDVQHHPEIMSPLITLENEFLPPDDIPPILVQLQEQAIVDESLW